MTNTKNLDGKEVKEMFKSGRKYWLIIVVAIALMAGSVDRSLATQLLTIDNNPGFENLIVSDGSWVNGYGSIPGWDILPTSDNRYKAGTYNPTGVQYTGGSDNVAFSNGSTIYQLLPYNLTAGHLYTLSVEVGDRLDTPFPGYSIGLWAGDSPITPNSYNFPTPANGAFATATWTYLALSSGGQLEIRLLSNGVQTNFDNVSLTNQNHAAVPEPATLLLLGSGLLGTAWFGKKKFKA